MQRYNCLIVEDEPLAAEVLEDYIRQVPFLHRKATCPDAISAMAMLQNEQVDLIFLDIHLPGLKGVDFLKTLKTPPQAIITSAYPDYALQGYELNVLDYLLKPIEFSRFVTAVNKLGGALPSTPTTHAAGTTHSGRPIRPHLFFHVSKKKVKVFLDEILYIESLSEYIRIITRTGSILTKFQLGEVEGLLAGHHFLRIHRSFIVAIDKIDAFSATDVEIGGKQLPIGRSYKDQVLAALG
ncbi:MAG TPA: LytTR family DNA-binding domain-containing protein [Puia sp.]|nr:LytTR family DNA-binding domain-containing protein [Puia sp.]